MDARAVSINTLVGDGEDDIRSTKPLIGADLKRRGFLLLGINRHLVLLSTIIRMKIFLLKLNWKLKD